MDLETDSPRACSSKVARRIVVRSRCSPDNPPPNQLMNQQGTRRVLAILDDLFFRVKIADAAKRAGLGIDFVSSEKEALEKAGGDPLLIILDLNCLRVQPIEMIVALKSNEATKGISLLGYVSHVQGELKQKAHDSGCNMVMARSAFSLNLPQILKRYAGAA